MSELTNPYSLSETLERLRRYLTSGDPPWGAHEALELLKKAENKAKVDQDYAQRMEDALLRGSTVECRAIFADFGDYWAKPRAEFPYYPHHDDVNMIDTALYHIKLGDVSDAIADSGDFS